MITAIGYMKKKLPECMKRPIPRIFLIVPEG